MEEKNTSYSKNMMAKNIVITVFLTIVIIFASLYAVRDLILGYVVKELEPNIQTMLPVMPQYVSDEQKIMAAIEKSNPAVVSVIVTKDVPVYERYFETFDPWGLFGGFSIPRVRENGTEEREVGGGSGFIVSSDGLIVTNRHVVSDTSARYSIVLTDGTVYPVSVVAMDEQLDIAVVKISEVPTEQLTTLHFSTSPIQLGQTVIVIGNALAEFQNSVSVGVVSGISRSITASDGNGASEDLFQVIQTDAAINPGNSGGPLLNIAGEVIGVNVATSQGADNIGFALPAAMVKQIIDSIKKYGEIVRPYLGVRYVMLEEPITLENGEVVSYGAVIRSGEGGTLPAVQPNSPAEKAGLQTEDIIVSVDGISLKDADLATLLRTKAVSETVELEIIRDGVQEKVSVTLEKTI